MRWSPYLAVLLIACSSQTATSPAGSSTPHATSTPAAASTPPSPACELAVIQGSAGQGSGPQQPGFLNLASNTFAPAGDAGDGMYYDRPLKRWVLAGPPALSADGARFVYGEVDTSQTTIHLVTVEGGKDVVIAKGGPWRLVGQDHDNVLAMRVRYVETQAFGTMQIGQGLWKMPIDGGSPTQLTGDSRRWEWVAAGGAFGDISTVDTAGAPNDVVRLDLATGRLGTWFSPHQRSFVLAVDEGGVPFVLTQGDNQEVWRVADSSQPIKVWSGPNDGVQPGGRVAVDGSDVWFNGSSLSR